MKGSRISGWLDLGSLLVIIASNILTIIFIHPHFRIVIYPAYFLLYFFIILAMISSFFERQVDNRKIGSKNHHFIPASPQLNLMFLYTTFPFVVILIPLSGEGIIDTIIALFLFVLWIGSEILALFAYLVYSENVSIIEWEKEELRRERKKFRQEIKSDKKYAKIDAERMERWKTKMLEIDLS